MKLSLIAAVDLTGLLGREGSIPWHLPAELDFFRRTTMGKPVIMGRRTFEALEQPLEGRQNIVLSRSMNFSDKKYTTTATSLEQALELAASTDPAETIVAGGREIYEQTLPRAEQIYLSVVQAEFEGDVYFPEFNSQDWEQELLEEHPADEENRWPFRVYLLKRRGAGSTRTGSDSIPGGG